MFALCTFVGPLNLLDIECDRDFGWLIESRQYFLMQYLSEILVSETKKIEILP